MQMESKALWLQLFRYCQAHDWAGYDPYDALNSPLFSSSRLFQSRVPRVAVTQLLKRSPVNLRSLLRIPATQNPKGLALCLSAVLRVPELIASDGEDWPAYFAERITALRSPDTASWCWGYSFPWQSRSVTVRRGEPNLVCTTFVAQALLDLYERRLQSRYLEMAVSAAEYILGELYWSDGGAVAGFSYPLPSVRNQVHNANLLASALLARIYVHLREDRFLDPALKVARYSAARQEADGSWFYGEAPSQQWIDNFHTGYNLSALRSISLALDTTEFETSIKRGLAFYRNHFFREDGAPRYFHNRTYPIDIHCVAQSMITLLDLQDLHDDNLRLAYAVLRYAAEHLHDPEGYFWYRELRFGTVRTSYMRWSQAWMLIALARMIEAARMMETSEHHETQVPA